MNKERERKVLREGSTRKTHAAGCADRLGRECQLKKKTSRGDVGREKKNMAGVQWKFPMAATQNVFAAVRGNRPPFPGKGFIFRGKLINCRRPFVEGRNSHCPRANFKSLAGACQFFRAVSSVSPPSGPAARPPPACMCVFELGSFEKPHLMIFHVNPRHAKNSQPIYYSFRRFFFVRRGHLLRNERNSKRIR